MTRRRWLWAAVPIALICAMGVYIAILPNDYDCSGFAVRGGRVTSIDGRSYTCEEATALLRAVFRGEGDR